MNFDKARAENLFILSLTGILGPEEMLKESTTKHFLSKSTSDILSLKERLTDGWLVQNPHVADFSLGRVYEFCKRYRTVRCGLGVDYNPIRFFMTTYLAYEAMRLDGMADDLIPVGYPEDADYNEDLILLFNTGGLDVDIDRTESSKVLDSVWDAASVPTTKTYDITRFLKRVAPCRVLSTIDRTAGRFDNILKECDCLVLHPVDGCMIQKLEKVGWTKATEHDIMVRDQKFLTPIQKWIEMYQEQVNTPMWKM